MTRDLLRQKLSKLDEIENELEHGEKILKRIESRKAQVRDRMEFEGVKDENEKINYSCDALFMPVPASFVLNYYDSLIKYENEEIEALKDEFKSICEELGLEKEE